MPQPDQWLQMRSVNGMLILFVTVADKRADIVFEGQDLDELARFVRSAVEQRRAASVRSGGYGHRVCSIGGGSYRISWSYDVKHRGQRGRYPRSIERITDLAGALRFSKRWAIAMPKEAWSW